MLRHWNFSEQKFRPIVFAALFIQDKSVKVRCAFCGTFAAAERHHSDLLTAHTAGVRPLWWAAIVRLFTSAGMALSLLPNDKCIGVSV